MGSFLVAEFFFSIFDTLFEKMTTRRAVAGMMMLLFAEVLGGGTNSAVSHNAVPVHKNATFCALGRRATNYFANKLFSRLFLES